MNLQKWRNYRNKGGSRSSLVGLLLVLSFLRSPCPCSGFGSFLRSPWLSLFWLRFSSSCSLSLFWICSLLRSPCPCSGFSCILFSFFSHPHSKHIELNSHFRCVCYEDGIADEHGRSDEIADRGNSPAEIVWLPRTSLTIRNHRNMEKGWNLAPPPVGTHPEPSPGVPFRTPPVGRRERHRAQRDAWRKSSHP